MESNFEHEVTRFVASVGETLESHKAALARLNENMTAQLKAMEKQAVEIAVSRDAIVDCQLLIERLRQRVFGDEKGHKEQPN